MKTKLPYIFIIVFLSFAALFIACKKNISTLDNNPVVPVESNEQITNFLQNNLRLNYQLLSSTSDEEDAVILSKMKVGYVNEADAKKNFDEIVARRESLKLDQLTYKDSKASLDEENTKIEINSNEYNINAAVDYKLETNSKNSETGEPITTEGIDYYSIILIVKDGSFLIKEGKKAPDFPVSESSEELLSLASTISDANSSQSSLSSNSLTTYYNAQSAVNYAIRYYNSPNRNFYDYSSSGGDCTNFLSQCLNYGGWPMVNAWHWLSNGNSCDLNMTTCKRSPAWTGAPNFYQYITGGGAARVIRRFSNIQVYFWYSLPSTRDNFRNTTSVVNLGDIIQLSTTTSTSTVHHSTLVTNKDYYYKQIFVTYRNASGYPVAKDKYIGDFTGGQYLQGFSVKASF